MLYTIIKKILFSFDPETAHKITLSGLDWAHRVRLLPILFPSWNSSQSVEVMGLTFPNRIGLAAGLDKNGDHIDSLSALGFGFIEVGTVTPRPQ
ncbi:MAG: quinone-dependent dihydroorotate dehydrogenase, partial [Gammaproteobacteria bacterium]|nr:quinone-dependent dihydroorotate dehydrogenase [Gammaproteobacteria bacterium]